MSKKILEQIHKVCDGKALDRDIPEEAKKIARENNIVVLVGGSDDLMYAYGADCYLTRHIEHSCWEGITPDGNFDDKYKSEAMQLGLYIYWCGRIKNTDLKLDEYNKETMGAFTYKVAEDISFVTFKVIEPNSNGEVFCTGIAFELPVWFQPMI